MVVWIKERIVILKVKIQYTIWFNYNLSNVHPFIGSHSPVYHGSALLLIFSDPHKGWRFVQWKHRLCCSGSSRSNVSHANIWSTCHFPWFSHVIPGWNCFSRWSFTCWTEQPTNFIVLALLMLPLSAERKRLLKIRLIRYTGSVRYLSFARALVFFLYSGRWWLFLCDARYFSRLFLRHLLLFAFFFSRLFFCHLLTCALIFSRLFW